MAETGCEVIVGDPIPLTRPTRATGDVVPVLLKPQCGSRIAAGDIADRLIQNRHFATTPHNPVSAVLNDTDTAAIGALAMCMISGSILKPIRMILTGSSPRPGAFGAADRVIVVSSISKSHAAPGFRSGWCVGPESFTATLLPLSETMLFGNQPFIADMTEQGIRNGSSVAPGMTQRFARRAKELHNRLSRDTLLQVHRPQAGMFAMIDVSATGMNGNDYALHLLEYGKVAVMPGMSFGSSLENWVRVALTLEDAAFTEACDRIIAHAKSLEQVTA